MKKRTPKTTVQSLPCVETGTWEALATRYRGPFQPRPCLIGPTGCGKTSRVLEFASRIGLPVHRVPLDGLPEEIIGIPRVRAGQTYYTRPDWLPIDTPAIIFLDELDKISSETRAAILTFLAERRLHTYKLHEDSIIVCAMQPLQPGDWDDATGLALRSRLAFFPFNYDLAYLAQQLSVPALNKLDLPSQKIEAPFAPGFDSRRLSFAVTAYKDGFDFLNAMFDAATAETLRALLTAELADSLLEKHITSASQIEPALLASITPQHAAHLCNLSPKMAPEVWEQLVLRACDGNPLEDLSAVIKNTVNSVIANDGLLFGDYPPEKCIPIIERTIAQVWERIAEWKKAHGELK